MSDTERLNWLQSQLIKSQAVPGTWWLHFHGWHKDLRKAIDERIEKEEKAKTAHS